MLKFAHGAAGLCIGRSSMIREMTVGMAFIGCLFWAAARTTILLIKRAHRNARDTSACA